MLFSTYSLLLFLVPALAVSAAYCPPDNYGGEPLCPPAVIALATGIALNILGQNAELNATELLQSIEAATPVNETDFLIAKGMLLADIAAGITIRTYNLDIAPAGNPAIPGLEKYAAAQLVEQGLAESLTGVPSHDDPILATLVSDITAGTMLNEDNLANATSGCNLGYTIPFL